MNRPTRARGDDRPHILDLVLTNEPFIDNIQFLAPLGKSGHSILNIHCSTRTRKIDHVVKYNYSKGDYDSLRQSCRINWEDRLNMFRNDTENMWEYFKT